MIKISITVISLLLFSGDIIASVFTNPIGGKSAGIGNASVTFTDFWALHNNQAGLAFYKNIASGLYYENRFLVNELSLKSGGFVLPANSGVFGLSFIYFGYSGYSERKIGLAYGRSFGKSFSLGLQLDYLTNKIGENYGSKNGITFEFGMQFKLTKELVLGVHVFNPIGVKLHKENDEKIPSIFKFGLSYSVSDDILVSLETEKDMNFKPLIRGGIEYKMVKQAVVRVGYSTLPSPSGSENMSMSSIYTFGFGLRYKKLEIDLSSSIHQTLGWTPQVSIVYKLK